MDLTYTTNTWTKKEKRENLGKIILLLQKSHRIYFQRKT